MRVCNWPTMAQATGIGSITEFPDQTVIGDAFRLAHTAQQAAVLAAYAAWQEIMQNR